MKVLAYGLVLGTSFLLSHICDAQTKVPTPTPMSKSIPAHADHLIEGYQWQSEIPLSTDAIIVIENPYGNISLRSTQAESPSLIGHIQRNKQSTGKVDIKIQESPSLVKINVFYPEGHFQQAINSKDRIDIGLVVPQDRRVKAKTGKGDISGKNLISVVEAESDSGEISLKTSSAVKLTTNNGPIAVSFDDIKIAEASHIHSDSGKIALTVRSDAAAQITAKSEAGKVETINSTGEKVNQGKTFQRELGSNGQRIAAVSISGDVHLRIRNPVSVSTTSSAVKVSKRLTDLPPPKVWQPGDPIREIPIGVIDRSTSTKKKSDPTEK